MTRILGDPDAFVADALRGFAAVHRGRVELVDGGVVRAQPLQPGRVAVLIGGGSGHYPAFAGFVGPGMAAGAVCGNIFTSPSTAQALRVAAAADAGGGVLFAFGRYAGDVLHFGEAERRLREDGVDARTVLITDDVASAPASAADERRGIAGILCVIHVAGAAADRGDSLDEVERLAAHANSRTRSHGVAFAGCTVPGADHPLFEVPPGVMSIGLGIHGEPGVRDAPLLPAPDLAQALAAPLLAERPDGATRAAVVLNGLGTVKYEELFVLYGYVAEHLESRGIEIIEPECGEFVTSLDMAGVSLSILWLDDELEELWRAPAATPAFRRGDSAPAAAPPARPRSRPASRAFQAPRPVGPGGDGPAPAGSRAAAAVARDLLRDARDAVAREAEHLGELDAVAGDGDHGVGMQRGLTAAVDAADGATDAGVRSLLARAGEAWSETAGGTSGALWGAALTKLGETLGDADDYGDERIADAVAAACARIAELGGAAPGDKTMLDAFVPFADELRARLATGARLPTALSDAAGAARDGAAATAGMVPRVGRARPLAERSAGHPDPGAVSFAMIVEAIARTASSGADGAGG